MPSLLTADNCSPGVTFTTCVQLNGKRRRDGRDNGCLADQISDAACGRGRTWRGQRNVIRLRTEASGDTAAPADVA